MDHKVQNISIIDRLVFAKLVGFALLCALLIILLIVKISSELEPGTANSSQEVGSGYLVLDIAGACILNACFVALFLRHVYGVEATRESMTLYRLAGAKELSFNQLQKVTERAHHFEMKFANATFYLPLKLDQKEHLFHYLQNRNVNLDIQSWGN